MTQPYDSEPTEIDGDDAELEAMIAAESAPDAADLGAAFEDNVDDGNDDDTADDDEPETHETSPASGSAKTAKRAGPDRALIRRVATKVIDVLNAPVDQRETLVSLLGATSSEPVDLTLAIMTAGRTAMAPVNDLLTVADTDPFEVGIVVMSMEKPRMKAMWALATQLGVIDGTIPAVDAKAAMALAKASRDLTGDHRATLDAVVTLARRGW